MNHEWYRVHGERLKVARRNLGISEQDAAIALNVPLDTYRKWEAGESCQIDKHLQGICNYALSHGVSLEWLLAGRGSPPRFRPRLVF